MDAIGSVGAAASAVPTHHGLSAVRVEGPPSSSAEIDTRAITTISGELGKYEILHVLDRDTADSVTAETGLPIRFPIGMPTLKVVTTWTETAPRGKLFLGGGQSGVFCPGRSVQTGNFVGLKLGRSGSGTDNEVAVQRALKGVPHILQAIDFCQIDTNRCCQVVRLAGLGSLNRLRVPIHCLDDTGLANELRYHIAQGLLGGLANMHERGYCHRDVKPHNVVVTHDGDVLLIDFDCSVRTSDGFVNILETQGDPLYAAPEATVANGSGAMSDARCSGPKLDAWGAGLCLLGLVSERTIAFDPRELHEVLDSPFEQLSPALRELLQGYETRTPRERFERLISLRLPIPDGDYGQVIRGLLAIKPDERLTVREALELPWFQEMERAAQGGDSLVRLKEMVQNLTLVRDREILSHPSTCKLYSPHELPSLSLVNHVERGVLQRRILSHLVSDSTQTVLTGAPGMGKSQLAGYLLSLEQVRQHFGLRLWFRGANDATQIESQYVTLAQELGLATEQTPFSEAFAKLKRYLAKMERPWLMVFDNADQPGIVDDYLIPSGGHTLITSRSEKWEHSIPVGPLSEEDARQLVNKLLGGQHADASLLCDELANLPLCIVQACAYIRNKACPIPDYVARLHGSTKVLPEEQRQDGYRNLPYSMETLYELTFTELREAGALPLLHRLACLAPDEIPQDLVDQLIPGPRRIVGFNELSADVGIFTSEASLIGAPDLDNAVRLLVDYAMLQPSRQGVYSMHRLPRRVIRRNFSSSDLVPTFSVSASVLSKRVYPERTSAKEITANRQMLGHGLSLIALKESMSSPSVELREPMAVTLCWTARELRYSGQLTRAIPLVETLMRQAERVWDRTDPWFINSQMLAASVALDRGDAQTGERLIRLTLELQRSALGDDHIDVARSLINLAAALEPQGQLDQAIASAKEALAIQKRAPGDQRLEIARSLGNLGSLHANSSDPNQAIDYHNQSLRMQREVLGDRHPDVAICHENLGFCFIALNELSKAARHLTEALRIFNEVLGEGHPEAARSLTGRGHIRFAQRDFSGARDDFSQALQLELANFGPIHPAVALTQDNLGRAWLASGQSKEAIQCLSEGLRVGKEVLPESHPRILSSLRHLAEAHSFDNDPDSTIACLKEVVTVLRLKYTGPGPVWGDESELFDALDQLAEALQFCGQYVEAAKQYAEMGKLSTEGCAPPGLIAQSFEGLGAAAFKLNHFDRAADCFERAATCRAAQHGERHDSVVHNLLNFGKGLRASGEPSAAIAPLRRALAILDRLEQQNRTLRMLCHDELGVASFALEDHEGAINFFKMAWDEACAVNGEESEDAANFLARLGSARAASGESEAAAADLTRALEVQRVRCADTPLRIADTLRNLALVRQGLGDSAGAIPLHQEVLDITVGAYGESDATVADCLDDIGSAWEDLGDLATAAKFYRQAYQMTAQLEDYGSEHPLTLSYKENWERTRPSGNGRELKNLAAPDRPRAEATAATPLVPRRSDLSSRNCCCQII